MNPVFTAMFAVPATGTVVAVVLMLASSMSSRRTNL